MGTASGPRMTIPTQLVLQAFLADPTAGLPSGTVHPILARLEACGWLTSAWEDVDPRAEGRPARRYYLLTGLGSTSARHALTRAYRSRTTRLRPADGLT